MSLILLDIAMRGLSGLETLERLRRVGAKTPILLMSGYSRERMPSDLADDPTVSFLAKPFGSLELRTAVENLVSSSSTAATS